LATIIDGKELSLKKRAEITIRAEEFAKTYGRPPGLAVVLVGNDSASGIYVRNKKIACEQTGIRSFEYRLEEMTAQQELLKLIDDLNERNEVDGILVQLPLPSHLDEKEVLLRIDPAKDVDGFHPFNMGRLLEGDPTLVPCTPKGIIYMLHEYGVEIKGKDAVIIGRSNIVGKPIALLLMMEHATITICHSRTKGLKDKVAGADIVVAAIGKTEMICGDWIKDGAVVIDVGMNRSETGKLKGDVQFSEAEKHASLITPVPGGVGPMTITMLLDNTLIAALARTS
jgi:methylenetetrahydrofolate dehydrogenase (NADP+) / methenyltetrahydrofolate cyclohydrolase